MLARKQLSTIRKGPLMPRRTIIGAVAAVSLLLAACGGTSGHRAPTIRTTEGASAWLTRALKKPAPPPPLTAAQQQQAIAAARAGVIAVMQLEIDGPSSGQLTKKPPAQDVTAVCNMLTPALQRDIASDTSSCEVSLTSGGPADGPDIGSITAGVGQAWDPSTGADLTPVSSAGPPGTGGEIQVVGSYAKWLPVFESIPGQAVPAGSSIATSAPSSTGAKTVAAEVQFAGTGIDVVDTADGWKLTDEPPSLVQSSPIPGNQMVPCLAAAFAGKYASENMSSHPKPGLDPSGLYDTVATGGMGSNSADGNTVFSYDSGGGSIAPGALEDEGLASADIREITVATQKTMQGQGGLYGVAVFTTDNAAAAVKALSPTGENGFDVLEQVGTALAFHENLGDDAQKAYPPYTAALMGCVNSSFTH